MTDLAYTIAQTDLSNATKEQLKNFVKAIRESWGKVIDLRKADAIALKQYLEDYLAAQVAEEVTPTENAETETVTPEPEVATSNIEEITAGNETLALSDFEGITDTPKGDWFASCPLSCDVCNYQVCELPSPQFLEMFEPSKGDLIGQYCDIRDDLQPYYVAANYIDEGESNYWFGWWAVYNYAKRQLIGATEAAKHSCITTDDDAPWLTGGRSAFLTDGTTYGDFLDYDAECAAQFQPELQPAPVKEAAIIGLCILTAIALIADLIAIATVWAIRKVRDTRLVQKGFRAAASAINTRIPKARGFVGA